MTSMPPPPADDAVEHLWNAAHEFLRAVRMLVDAADEFVTQQQAAAQAGERDARIHRIDIDLDADADSEAGAGAS
jgi:hypothetical protein